MKFAFACVGVAVAWLPFGIIGDLAWPDAPAYAVITLAVIVFLVGGTIGWRIADRVLSDGF